MGLNKAIFGVSSSTCHLLSGCLDGLGVRFHGRTNTSRVMSSVRHHVSRLFTRGLSTNSRMVAVTSIRRIVTHVKGPRSVRARKRDDDTSTNDAGTKNNCNTNT